MIIGGFHKLSTVDWPGKLAACVFTSGCTMKCAYCHNHSLIAPSDEGVHSCGEILEFLQKRQGMLDGLVVTGGEPTIQRGLEDFIREVRALGFGVKLDTNGTRPKILKRLCQEGLLDYVAMDMKAPYALYDAVSGVPVNLGAVEESIGFLLAGSVEYEFRTTVLPYFDASDMRSIGDVLAGAKRYVLQQYRHDTRVLARDRMLTSQVHNAQWFIEAVEDLDSRIEDVSTRGIDLSAALQSA